jgi:phosphatidylglycerol:prolipoprotein diacylglycerol transferase
MLPVLVFPEFNRALITVGPFQLRWYALAYIAALLLGWRLVRRLVAREPVVATGLQVDDFLTWATLGVVLGGRLGYVLFYQPEFYLAHPLQIPAVWHGGMSFHGGMLGVTIAILWFCRRESIRVLAFADRIAVAVPLGLGLGRVANFINGELPGRPAPAWLPWAMLFPNYEANPIPRHPSEIYEALLEGVVLFAVLFAMSRSVRIRQHSGVLTGTFLLGYGIARITAEFFRQPDPFLGYLVFGATMGQLLSIPLVLAGIGLIVWASQRTP